MAPHADPTRWHVAAQHAGSRCRHTGGRDEYVAGRISAAGPRV
ncbi:hypothetical protein PJP10_19880 [Mycobacterium kansasii]|uniref:Uncharacterized protein n=1 Tax=Mycobacterium kansasii TaxID=1768 RepID=A0A1V3XUB0_MYCKA|nr:hypothetical protein BZL30_0634 [Mycobacterium kansasii]